MSESSLYGDEFDRNRREKGKEKEEEKGRKFGKKETVVEGAREQEQVRGREKRGGKKMQ